MSKLLYKIAGRIVGIAYDDLTTAEQQIADLLIKNGWLTRQNNDLAYGPKSQSWEDCLAVEQELARGIN